MSKFAKITLLVVIGLVILGFVLLKCRAANDGDVAPEISAKLIDGSDFKLSDLRGDYVLLSFWGSWCGPCRVKSPSMIDFHQRLKNKIKIVSVALEKDQGNGVKAAKHDGFSWEYQIEEESSFVVFSGIAQDYGVTDIPAMFLISPDGILLGEKTLEEIEIILE